MEFLLGILIFFVFAILVIAFIIFASVIGFGIRSYKNRPSQNNHSLEQDISNDIDKPTIISVQNYFTDSPTDYENHSTNFSDDSKDYSRDSSTNSSAYYVRIFAVIFMALLRVDKLLWQNVNSIGLIILLLIIPFALYISNKAIQKNNIVLWEVSLWVAAIIPLSVITSTVFN